MKQFREITEMKQFYVLFVLVVAASAASDSDGLITSTLKFVKDCNEKSLTLCIKVRQWVVIVQTIESKYLALEPKTWSTIIEESRS